MTKLERYGPLAGRLLIALPFLDFGIYKLTNWTMMVGWLEMNGLPLPALLLGAAIVLELVGGTLLIAGARTRWVAVALALYLVPVTFLLHDFWTFEGIVRQGQRESFGKGLMIIGGLIFVALQGAGAVSLDERRERPAAP